MAFINSPRFPECVSLGATGGPGWMTDIARTQGGQEYRNRVRSRALGKWEVAHLVRSERDWQELLAFWYIAAGAFNDFRFKDHLDFSATSSEGVFTLLTATTFQMEKIYRIASLTYRRPIKKPVSPTITVVGGSGASVNYTTGIVTVSSGTPTAWAGQFDVPVRFGIDDLEQEAVTRTPDGGILVSWRSIPLVETVT